VSQNPHRLDTGRAHAGKPAGYKPNGAEHQENADKRRGVATVDAPMSAATSMCVKFIVPNFVSGGSAKATT
jgi:hypothetical protein